MALPLDDSISAGQAGHIADHETIATVLNAIDAAASGDVATTDGSTLTFATRAALAGDTAFTSKYVQMTGTQTIAGAKTFSSDVAVPDEAYDATAWNGSLEVPTKNAVRDKIESLPSASVSDTAYGSGWDGDTTTAPSKNAVYDKIRDLTAGSILSLVSYNPNSMVSTATTTTLTDLDATNLAATFTAPESGKVLIRLEANAYCNSGSGALLWGLRSGSSTVKEARIGADLATNSIVRFTKTFLITGLTPGNSYTYKWAQRHITAGWTTRYGGETSVDLQGEAIIEVVAAPF